MLSLDYDCKEREATGLMMVAYLGAIQYSGKKFTPRTVTAHAINWRLHKRGLSISSSATTVE